MVDANRDCYRAQCFATARALAARLALPEGLSSVTFQSRLGRTPWIQPYTDVALLRLASQGKKRLVVFCPAFVADCLETLEEIGIRAKHDFVAAGGEDLTLVPSLNDSSAWVDAVIGLVRRQAERNAPSALATLMICLIPVFTFTIAVLAGHERFGARRIAGLLLAGLGGSTQHPIASTLVSGAYPGLRSRTALLDYAEKHQIRIARR